MTMCEWGTGIVNLPERELESVALLAKQIQRLGSKLFAALAEFV